MRIVAAPVPCCRQRADDARCGRRALIPCVLSDRPQIIDDDAFDVIVVSPRNHFLFTPMLPSTCVGTVRESAAAPVPAK